MNVRLRTDTLPSDSHQRREREPTKLQYLSMRGDSGIDELLSLLLPPRASTLLLRACLDTPAKALDAWHTWLKLSGNPRSTFEKDRTGLKGLLPFIEHSFYQNRIDVGEEFQTYLRVSSLREKLRSDIYREVLNEILSTFNTSGINTIVMKGAVLSETVYDQPHTRHNHAIDLLVDKSQMDVAIRALKKLSFTPCSNHRYADHDHAEFCHNSGLPVVLHTQLFYLPHYHSDLTEIWQRRLDIDLGGIRAAVLSPADNLLHVCGHASYSRTRCNLRWVCDAVLIVQRHPNLDWNVVVENACSKHMAMPIRAMLEYLSREFDVQIPANVFSRLGTAATHANALDLEAVLAGVTMGLGSRVGILWKHNSVWRLKFHILRFLLLPSPLYMQWRYGSATPGHTTLRYVYRPIRFIAYRIYRMIRMPR